MPSNLKKDFDTTSPNNSTINHPNSTCKWLGDTTSHPNSTTKLQNSA